MPTVGWYTESLQGLQRFLYWAVKEDRENTSEGASVSCVHWWLQHVSTGWVCADHCHGGVEWLNANILDSGQPSTRSHTLSPGTSTSSENPSPESTDHFHPFTRPLWTDINNLTYPMYICMFLSYAKYIVINLQPYTDLLPPYQQCHDLQTSLTYGHCQPQDYFHPFSDAYSDACIGIETLRNCSIACCRLLTAQGSWAILLLVVINNVE